MTARSKRKSSDVMNAAGVIMLALTFVLPVGDPPWTSFWREWSAAIAALLIVLSLANLLRELDSPLRLRPASLATMALALAAVCWLQLATGMLNATSDALIPSLYLSGFAACFVVAESMPQQERERLADQLAMAMLGAALLSAPLAVMQWVGWLRLELGIRVAGGRPVAHMEQANLLCSLIVQGLVGAWRLVERGWLGRGPYLAFTLVLLTTSILTQSRVALLVCAVLILVLIWRRNIVRWQPHGQALLVITAMLAAGALLLPWVSAQFGLNGAALSERASAGRRPAAWMLFLDAVKHRPWAGWGALQNGEAQYAVAMDHQPLAWYFSSAHNIVVDLMLWFGLPIGLFAGAALLLAGVWRIGKAPDGAALATSFAAVCLLLHGLVELPLHYLYFLLPLGFYLGLTTPSQSPKQRTLALPSQAKLTIPVLALASAAVLAVVAHEYNRITEVRPVPAIEKSAGISILSTELPAPDVVLLDRLRDYHLFAAIPLRAGLSRDELELARRVASQQPFPSSLEKYALLAALNGRAAEAHEVLDRLCKLTTSADCAKAQGKWQSWRDSLPQLPDWPRMDGVS
jgi:O-antigen ligase